MKKLTVLLFLAISTSTFAQQIGLWGQYVDSISVRKGGSEVIILPTGITLPDGSILYKATVDSSEYSYNSDSANYATASATSDTSSFSTKSDTATYALNATSDSVYQTLEGTKSITTPKLIGGNAYHDTLFFNSGGYIASIDTGKISILDLNTTGTPSATTFMRGDSTWAVPAGGSGGTIQNANLSIQPADEGTTTGNARGANAVDLQTSRSLSTEVASGDYSTIIGGSGNTVSASYSNASGRSNTVSASYSNASGRSNTVSEIYSSVSGFQNTVSGFSSNASGDGNTVSGIASSASGSGNTVSASYSNASGLGNTAATYGEMVIGLYSNLVSGTATSYVATDPLFRIGNGTSTSARSDAFRINKNGNTTINGDLTVNSVISEKSTTDTNAYSDGSYSVGATPAKAYIESETFNNILLTSTTIANNDATPDVSGGSIFTYNGTANSVTITDFDNPIVGNIYTIIGNSDTYTITINDSGNFNLSANWVGGIDDVITIYVQADNDYIQISRSDN